LAELNTLQNTNCIIYAPLVCKGPELEYIANYILVERLGFSSLQIEYLPESYGQISISIDGTSVRIFSSDFFENYLGYINNEIIPISIEKGKEYKLFAKNGDLDINFDLFAACFYTLNRIEELPSQAERDKHNRFASASSVLVKHTAHRLPIVDFWINELRNLLIQKGLDVAQNEQFAWWNTIDIDQVFAQKFKSKQVQIGGIIKNLLKGNFYTFKALCISFFGVKDPFEVLELMKTEKGRNLIFLLCGGNSAYDLTKGRTDKVLADFVKKHQNQFEFGIHPSYLSMEQPEIFKEEIDKLEQFTAQKIERSRQHYLRFTWPQTQMHLLQAGIKQDFSMGFANEIGFRSGTSRPYKMYDLYKREPTDLTIVPFCVMDVSLKNYLGLEPNAAIEELKVLIENVKQSNGLFVSLWHHESLSEIDGWKGWRNVYVQMKAYLEK